MKKIISVLLVLVLCIGLFAACNDNTKDNSNLESAKTLLNKTYNTAGKGQENKITADKELTTVIAVDGVRYQVAWALKITTGKDGAVILTDSEKENSRLLKLVDQSEEVHFTLTATISDPDGESVTQDILCYAPMIEKVEIPTSEIFLYNPNDKVYVTAESYLYKSSSSGTEKMELVVSADSGKAVALTVRENADGSVTFVTSDNQYLYCNGTDVKFVDAEDEYTLFILEGAEGGSYIKSVNGKYNDNNQYLELYSGYLTCYGLSSSSNVNLYTFKMVEAKVCEHEFKDVAAVEATCTTAGSTAGQECTKCGYTTGVETVKALGHEWGEWEIVKEATDTEDGTRKHTCTRCNETAEETYQLAKTEWVTVKNPEAGKAYKFGMVQGILEKTLYITGSPKAEQSYYLLTTEKAAEAADVYLETVDGGYNLYVVVDNTKTYINIIVTDTGYVNLALEATASTVYTVNDGLLSTEITGTAEGAKDGTYAFGTRNDKDYDTVGAVKTSYNGFHCYFYIEQEIKETVIADGTYSIGINNQYMGYLEESLAYGYPKLSDVLSAFTITNVDGGITIQDNLGRYLCAKAYNSVAVSKTPASEAEEHSPVWKVTKNDDGTYTLVDTVFGKTMAYSTAYTSVGIYADDKLTDEHTTKFNIVACETVEECKHANTEDVAAVDPTCTEKGSTAGKKCLDCGAVIGVETVDATGHSWSEWETVKEPTAEADGEKKRVCSVCNAEEVETVKLVPTEWVKVEQNPVVGTAYKFALTQASLGNKVLYATGAMGGNNNNFLATTENLSEAADFYIEAVDGGYKLYFNVSGVKQYINVSEYWKTDKNRVGSSQKLVETADEASVFVWNSELNIFTVTLTYDHEGDTTTTTYCLGTYGTYDTMSASSTYYITGDNASNIGVSQFLSYLYVEQEVTGGGEGGETGGNEGGETGGNEGGETGGEEGGETGTVAGVPSNLVFTGLENRGSADDYMKEHYAEWTITGTLGQGYANYLGFGRSGDKQSAITSPNFTVDAAFSVRAVIKGNGNNGELTSTLTFALLDKDGNVIATGATNGISAICPVDQKDTTYDISFTFVDGKTWSDVSNLRVSFSKVVGNIGLKSLDFVK